MGAIIVIEIESGRVEDTHTLVVPEDEIFYSEVNWDACWDECPFCAVGEISEDVDGNYICEDCGGSISDTAEAMALHHLEYLKGRGSVSGKVLHTFGITPTN